MVQKLSLKLDSFSIGRKISDIYFLCKLINQHYLLFRSIFKRIFFFTIELSLFSDFSSKTHCTNYGHNTYVPII